MSYRRASLEKRPIVLKAVGPVGVQGGSCCLLDQRCWSRPAQSRGDRSPGPKQPHQHARTHTHTHRTRTHGGVRPDLHRILENRAQKLLKAADVSTLDFRSSVRSSEIRRPSPPVLDSPAPAANGGDCRCRSVHPRRDKFKADGAAAISPGSRTRTSPVVRCCTTSCTTCTCTHTHTQNSSVF